MDDMPLVLAIKKCALSRSKSTLPEPASEASIKDAEKSLGFAIPRLLRLCYSTVGNGGFGPGYGVIGLEGGFASDYGTLVEAYLTLQPTLVEGYLALMKGKALPDESTSRTLLPFCEFGCNMYACVGCDDGECSVYSLEQGELFREKYKLQQFLEMWIDGIHYSSQQEGVEVVEHEIINPFTREKAIVRERRRRHL